MTHSLNAFNIEQSQLILPYNIYCVLKAHSRKVGSFEYPNNCVRGDIFRQ